MKKRLLGFFICIVIILMQFVPIVLAVDIEELEEVIEDFSIYAIVDGNKINSYIKDDINYLFLPKTADLTNLEIHYTGNIESIENAEFDKEEKIITGQFENESEFVINLKDGQTIKIVIMQSDVPSIFVDLDNNVTLDTVDNGSKETKYNGIVNTTGSDKNSQNAQIEFKGRGNTSWAMPKKSYQIKLNKKENFLGIGSSKEKKWVLIANYQDCTLLRNKIIDDLCIEAGLATCPNSTFADLYVNGNYVGNYLVCDKIEIKTNRVNLTNDKGVLVELDNAYYKEENYWFQSKRGNFYTIKESVKEDDATVNSAMSSFKQALDAFETELYSANPSWNKISKMIDVESFAKYYLINEFAENRDSYFSSCYLYKDGDDDVIHMGPTWDYDSAFGYNNNISNPNVDYTLNYAYGNEMQHLYTFPQFACLVNDIYVQNVKPALDKINVNEISEEYKNTIKINTLVWSNDNKYINAKNQLNTFINNRKSYFNTRYSNKQIEYNTHVENQGWKQTTRTGVSGTEGQSLRLEGLKIKIGSGYGENISVSYKTHVENIGWQNWVSNGEMAGTTGQGLRLEAVKIKLNNSSKYSIRYRVHVQNIGWTDWAYDGEVAGTEGKGLRLEAIEIQVVDNGIKIGKKEPNSDAFINYKAHIENLGDTGYGSDGEILGTIGKGLRLEGINIELGSTLPSSIHLSIDEHIQNIGWKYGLDETKYIGTKGQSLRIEALKFKLTGEEAKNYTIKYRVHVQDIGWQEWKQDGELAGTTGQSLRIEALQLLIEEK